MCRCQCRFKRVFTLRLQVFGEFYNQNGIFGTQTNHRNQTYLKIDVVGQAAPENTQHGTQKAQGHHQQHRHRNGPAFIQCGQTQEYRQDGEGIQDIGLRAGGALFARLAGPFKTKAFGQLCRQFFHFQHGITTAQAGHGAAGNRHRRIAVVAHGLHRTGNPAGLHHTRQRHRLALAIGNSELEDVFRLHAVGHIRLHNHPLQTPAVGEVVDIAGAQRSIQHPGNATKAHTLGAGGGAVDINAQLRGVFHTVGAHLGEHLALHRHAQQLISRGQQGFVTFAAAVLQAEIKAGAGAQFGNRRRRECKHHAVFVLLHHRTGNASGH